MAHRNSDHQIEGNHGDDLSSIPVTSTSPCPQQPDLDPGHPMSSPDLDPGSSASQPDLDPGYSMSTTDLDRGHSMSAADLHAGPLTSQFDLDNSRRPSDNNCKQHHQTLLCDLDFPADLDPMTSQGDHDPGGLSTENRKPGKGGGGEGGSEGELFLKAASGKDKTKQAALIPLHTSSIDNAGDTINLCREDTTVLSHCESVDSHCKAVKDAGFGEASNTNSSCSSNTPRATQFEETSVNFKADIKLSDCQTSEGRVHRNQTRKETRLTDNDSGFNKPECHFANNNDDRDDVNVDRVIVKKCNGDEKEVKHDVEDSVKSDDKIDIETHDKVNYENTEQCPLDNLQEAQEPFNKNRTTGLTEDNGAVKNSNDGDDKESANENENKKQAQHPENNNDDEEIADNAQKKYQVEHREDDKGDEGSVDNVECKTRNQLSEDDNNDDDEETVDSVDYKTKNQHQHTKDDNDHEESLTGDESETRNQRTEDDSDNEGSVNRVENKTQSQHTEHDNDDDDETVDNVEKKEESGQSDDKSDEDKDEDVNNNPRPKHSWRAVLDLRAREIGVSARTPPSLFREKVQGCLQMVERLKLQHSMKHHDGCVNSLHFNRIGTLLASGADDLQIVLWNWASNRKALVYNSGHHNNVFQARFMPYSGDCHVVSCARDGQVRLAELSLTGVCKNTKKLAQHRGAAHKIALEYDSPHVFLTCGEDAVAFLIDLREDKPHKLLVTKENEKRVPLYCIESNPVDSNQFLTSGQDHFIRIYDKRKLNENVNGGVVKKYCPQHLVNNSPTKTNVTCACYSYNGTEIVGSYNDDDIFVFDNMTPDRTEAVHRYSGHRNSATVKGVSFYGPHSDYIVSGSDCGHMFFWDKETEHVVQFLPADQGGVVNSLEPHPFAPVLATSGLDHDVKIWAPVSHDAPRMQDLPSVTRKNRLDRRREREGVHEEDLIDSQMLWFMMNQFRRSTRRRFRQGGEDNSSSSESDSDSDNDDDDDDDDNDDDYQHGGGADRVQCQTS